MEEAPHVELGRPLVEGVRAAFLRAMQTQIKTLLEQFEVAILKWMLAEIMEDSVMKQEAQTLLKKALTSQKEDGSFVFVAQEASQPPFPENRSPDETEGSAAAEVSRDAATDTFQAVEYLFLLSKFEETAKKSTYKALHYLTTVTDRRLTQLAKAYLALLDQDLSCPPPKEAIQGLNKEDALRVLTILYATTSDPVYLTEARSLLDEDNEEAAQLLEILVWKNSGYSVDFYPKDIPTRAKLAHTLPLDGSPLELAGILGYVRGEQLYGFSEIAASALGDFSPFIDNKIDPTFSVTGDSLILGARGAVHREVDGLLYLGRVTEHAPEEDMYGHNIQVDATFPHVILIAGMRGSGKSYTLGVFAEELARQDIGIGVLIVDPLGVFWSMKLPNASPGEQKLIKKWNLVPRGHPDKVKVFIPIGYYEEYPEESKDASFAIAPAELEAGDWAYIFKFDLQAPMGLLLRQAINKVQKGYQSAREGTTVFVPGKGEKYAIRELIECISTDVDLRSKERGFAKATRRALISRFMQVQSWGLFSSDQPTPLSEISKPGQVSVIDVSFLSTVEPGSVALVVGLLARRILQERIRIGRAEESAHLTGTPIEVDPTTTIPVTWLLIDEAHMLVPEGEKTAASQPLIEFAKQGRKPGCGLVLATQRPAATSDQVLSQVDLVMCHALVLEDDLRALLKRTPAKLPGEFKSPDFIRTLPVGASVVADQRTPLRTFVFRTRPRTSSHAGQAAKPSKIMRVTPAAVVKPETLEEKAEIPQISTDEPVGPLTPSEEEPALTPAVTSPPTDLEEEPTLTPTVISPPPTDLQPAVIQGYLSRKLLYGFKQFFFPPSRVRRTTETGYIVLQDDQWKAFQELLRNEGWTLKSSLEEESIAIHLMESIEGKLGFATIRKNGGIQTVWVYVGTNSAEIAFLKKYSPT